MSVYRYFVGVVGIGTNAFVIQTGLNQGWDSLAGLIIVVGAVACLAGGMLIFFIDKLDRWKYPKVLV